MEKLNLVIPTLEYKDKAIEYIEEFNIFFEEISGVGNLDKYLNRYDEWLEKIKEDRNSVYSEENVPTHTYFLVREEDLKIVGMINIRLKLNKFLSKYAGHISYSIRPSERRKGYGKYNLYLGLKVLNDYGEEKAFLDCSKNNIASKKVIEALGGKIINEYYDDIYGNGYIDDYEIDIKKSISDNKKYYE